MNDIITKASLTMSSREIADLVDARHNDVVSTIERLFEKGLLRSSRKTRREATGGRPVEVYDLIERDTHLVVAGYSDEHRARVIDRWQELEAKQNRLAVPQSLPEALRLAAEAIEERDRLALDNRVKSEALAAAEPKALALDRISAGDKSLTLTQAAKVLGVKRDILTNWLAENGWIYRQNGSWVAYQRHIQSGRLTYKEARYTDEEIGQEVLRPYCHISPKGLTILAQELRDEYQEVPAGVLMTQGSGGYASRRE